MTLTQIKYFLKIVETGSVSKASKELFISQPTISRSMAALEAEFGIQLFVRSKPVVLTEAGIVFMKKAEDIGASVQALYDTMQGFLGTKKEKHSLKIGYHHFDSNISSIILSAIKKLTEEHPSISIEISDFRSTKTSLLSSEPECDIVFTLRHDVFLFGSQIKYKHICDDPVIAVLPKSHRLSEKSSLLMKELSNCKVVLSGLNTTPLEKDLIYSAFDRAGISLLDLKRISNTNLFLTTILLEKRVALMPLSLANQLQLAETAEYTLLPVEDCRAGLDVIVAWRSEDANPAIPLFVNILLKDQM